ncbi:MAG: DUF308 domain-containing protein [Bacteroidales bacterium]|nr:DUF308 domain-containing protein [Eubacterium sp.]MCM1267799.1 DUF308 domain-containing protein [Bacteroidales bacterium]MCM1415558.1 DUF308 domain-containing protein [bacterium]MCM1424086.1 DUF308 domain-containing protein [bacterium]
MNMRRQTWSTLLLCITEAAVGVLLLIRPVSFTAAIIMVAGIALIASGIISIIRYFKSSPEVAVVSGLLIRGLVSVGAGAFCALNPQWFIATFPVIAVLYGIVVLIAGLGKVQLTVDLLRLKNRKWWWGAISAAVSILCAIVIISNPFSSTMVMWWFTGISLIVEAVFDLLTMIMSRRNSREID